jgi:diadenosine tetraphosphate (Ap4A) HIT family hydrolase
VTTTHFDDTCVVCNSIRHIDRISPGPFIHEGRYWNVDHAYPSSYRGWLVIVLKRHCTALHELSPEECLELGQLVHQTTHLLHQHFNSAKEYAMMLGEGEGFAHLHLHVVPRAADLGPEYRGPAIFKLLNPPEQPAMQPDEMIALSTGLQQQFRVNTDSA